MLGWINEMDILLFNLHLKTNVSLLHQYLLKPYKIVPQIKKKAREITDNRAQGIAMIHICLCFCS